jgi:hypothetical protein
MSLGRGIKMAESPIQKKSAAIGLIETGENLDERRLSGSIVTHQGDHFSSVHAEADSLQGLNSAKRFRDVFDDQ